MSLLLNLVLAVQMLAAIAMIGLILLQQGKGADMGAAFGSGSSGSLFGASGGASFMSRTTAVLAAVFFVCTLTLSYFGNLPTVSRSVLDTAVPASTAPPAPSTLPSTTTPAAPDNKNPAPASKQIPTK